nr:MAG TPA: hypothetical protein [Caudoviricetes sp.]DAJ43821.1 MAG TPA: hypothetical protein [Caudoviricetes sp.]
MPRYNASAPPLWHGRRACSANERMKEGQQMEM